MLGRALMAVDRPGTELLGVDLPEGDLTAVADITAIFADQRPDWVIHTAAYTDVDRAETKQDLAMQVNAEATANVCTACAQHGAGLTYLSTDYVFAGTASGYDEDSPREPINHYGLTKARGEEAVESRVPRWQIVRTSWLFGPGPRNFVLTVQRLLRERNELQVVDDQVGCPTYAPDLAGLLAWLVNNGRTGYYHGTNQGACTWFTFAREIARLSGADPKRIAPCASRDYPTPASRPACSILRSRNLELLGCPPRPTWQNALTRYVRLLADETKSG
jgi:dTDP-4-dehydrorhamnose reductase